MSKKRKNFNQSKGSLEKDATTGEQSTAQNSSRNEKKRGARRHNRRGKVTFSSPKTQTGREYNDVSWYMKDRTIVEAYAKLPFNFIIGNNLAGADVDSINFPAIVSYNVDWTTSPNCSTQVTNNNLFATKNLLDLVATSIYTTMRRANAGSTNGIEHVDVLISNLLASIDIYCNVHYIHRIFRSANSFSWKNRSVPRDIFSDHWNLDYDDFIANQANYRGRFDTLVALAQTIRTLANFPFIDAAKAQFSEIFKDTDTDTGREQLILSAKPFHHIYDAVGSDLTPGGMVRLMQARDVKGWSTEFPDSTHVIYTGTPCSTTAASHKYKLSALLDILEAQIYALINDADFNLIQADIEKAFGDQSGYIIIDPIRDVEPITPVYSGEFMTSFHNGTFYKLPVEFHAEAGTTGYKVFKSGSVVNEQFQVHDHGQAVEAAQDFGFWVPSTAYIPEQTVPSLIDLDTNDPSVEDIVIALRFKSRMDFDTKSHLPSEWKDRHPLDGSLGDNIYLLYASAISNFFVWGGNITLYSTSGSGAIKQVGSLWSNIKSGTYPNALLAVDHHPLGMDSNAYILSELNNIRYLRPSECLPIQEACFLSLWNVPEYTNI